MLGVHLVISLGHFVVTVDLHESDEGGGADHDGLRELGLGKKGETNQEGHNGGG